VPAPQPEPSQPPAGAAQPTSVPLFTGKKLAALRWKGEVPPQKWTTFYTKVLSRLVSDGGLSLSVEVEARPLGGVYAERADELRQNLRELGIVEEVEVEEGQE
jgi:hypothetical protein